MVMGVSGCGKSTVGQALAHRLDGQFVEGDDYHPDANVAHMAAGHPLTDAMRWPWLDKFADAVNEQRQTAVTVFACSALRKSYRDHLRAAIPDLQVAYLEVSQELVARRMSERQGHFMPASLLGSQFATLEAPLTATVSTSAAQTLPAIIETLQSALIMRCDTNTDDDARERAR